MEDCLRGYPVFARGSFCSARVVTLPQACTPFCSLLLALQGAALVFPVGELLQEAKVYLQGHAAIKEKSPTQDTSSLSHLPKMTARKTLFGRCRIEIPASLEICEVENRNAFIVPLLAFIIPTKQSVSWAAVSQQKARGWRLGRSLFTLR